MDRAAAHVVGLGGRQQNVGGSPIVDTHCFSSISICVIDSTTSLKCIVSLQLHMT
jgi:hypothetical protein